MRWPLVTLGPRSYPLHDAPEICMSDTSSEASFSSAASYISDADSVTSSSSSQPRSPRGGAFSVDPVKRSVKSRLTDRQTAAVNLEAEYDLPPDTLFDLLADPKQHERIFDAIEVSLR